MQNELFPRLPPLNVVELRPGGPVCELHFGPPGRHPSADPRTPRRLRLAIARSCKANFVLVAEHGSHHLCRWDIRQPVKGQIFEAVPPPDLDSIPASLDVRMTEGPEPLQLYAGGDDVGDGLEFLQPHSLAKPEGTPVEEMTLRLASKALLTEFNWMAGNVLDGILGGLYPEACAREIALSYLSHYIDFDGVSADRPGRCPGYSVEDTAPFATLARLAPGHPQIDRVLAFWKSRADERGCTIDHGRAVAEGNYTVAYPKAVIARMRGEPSLARAALTELALRRDRLVTAEGFWLRGAHGDTPRTFLNWARGVAWYFMGLSASLAELRAGGFDLGDLPDALRDAAARICGWQRADGLWGGFLHETDASPDTSGGAGIAAGLAIGLRAGLLPDSFHGPAVRATAGLERMLTPDGFMTGSTQRNTGEAGEAFQRSGYRIISPYATGLYAWALGQLQTASSRPMRVETPP